MRNSTSKASFGARKLAVCIFLLLSASVGWAQYCLPAYNNQCSSDDYINDVSFAGIVNLGTGCSSPSVSNYVDYTSTFTANCVINQPYTITVAPGAIWGQYFVAFVDLNHDNDFADPGEFFDIGYAAGGSSISSTITLPCGTLAGATRLRVMCRFSNTPLIQTDVCSTTLSYGEVEDYNLIATAPTNTDVVLTKFLSPVTACAMTANEQVSVQLKNVGGQTVNSYTICYRINNGAPVCETVSATILPCDSLVHVFATPANLSLAGLYDFDAYVTVPSDANAGNDSLHNYFVNNIPVVGTIPYSENFDAGNGGWTTGGTSSSWAWGVPAGTFINQAASPNNAWVTNLTGPYNLDESSYLISPCFNLSSLTVDPYISFSQLFEIEAFGDDVTLELSTNAGSTWTRVGLMNSSYNWYNSFNDSWNDVSGAAGAWRAADHQLTGAAGSANVRFRFTMDADAFGVLEGFGVDDVRLVDTIRNAGALAFTAPSTGCQLSSANLVSMTIQNFGSSPITNVPVCYTLNGGAATCEIVAGPIAPGATYTHTFAAPVNLSAVGSYAFVGYTNWAADYTKLNDTTRITVSSLPLINTFPYVEDFEAGAGSWTSGGNAFNDWALGTPAKSTIIGAASGTQAWVTGGLSTGTYENNADSWVASPCFDLTNLSSPWVLTKIWWNAEFSWDGVVLESSTDGGATWAQVGAFGDPFNWYTDNSVNGLSNVGLTGDGWSGRTATNDGSNGYVLAKHPVSNLGGINGVRFRMHFGSDGSVVDDGFAFDDFILAQATQVNLGPDTAICGSIALNPGLSGGSFLWSNGATTPTLLVTTPGTYILTYTDSLGLVDADTIVVSASPTPAVNLGNDRIICQGDSTCFTVNTQNYPSVIWSTGNTTGQICVSTAGLWSIQATDAIGCTSRDSIMTTVAPLPTPFLGNDTTLCGADTVCLSSNCGPGHTYIWSTGATTSQICVTNAIGYWVRCMDSNGCVGADSIILTGAPYPIAAGLADTSACPVVQFNNTSTGITAIWDFGDGNSSTLINPSHDYTNAGNGSYVVTLISTNNCGSDTTVINVDVNCLVSIGDGIDNSMKLFPNPSNGNFKLETNLSGSAPVRISILDIHGKAVYSQDFGQIAGAFSEEIHLDVAKGVYFVKMDVGGDLRMRKLILQ